jgi:bifunctional UDP-N-acetylglucosamine pyrophosphorylase/glucosamine-1-phosphate N-acetyltransferase
MSSLACVVLAAGEGKRMRSSRPKPLHLLCGRAMLLHLLDRVTELDAERAVVVVGHGAERITKKLVEEGPLGLPIEFVEQPVQRGTGDAVAVALTAFRRRRRRRRPARARRRHAPRSGSGRCSACRPASGPTPRR